jgi:hypothetical protein
MDSRFFQDDANVQTWLNKTCCIQKEINMMQAKVMNHVERCLRSEI